MRKEAIPSTALVIVLMLSALAFIPTASSQIPNPDEIVVATIWGPRTVDPAWCYDTASGQVIMNTYDTMIWFETNWTERDSDPGVAGKTDSFVGRIADDWVVPGGFNAPGGDGRWNTTEFPAVHPTAPGYTDSTYYFHIREGVQFHDSGTYGNVTPRDVEYSFERWMAFDRSGGPAWMIYEPLLELGGADYDDPNMAQMIGDSVEINATSRWVWFNLKMPNYPTMIFMQVVAQQWASILDQDWATEHDCWPGETYTNANMSAYYDPTVSPLDDWPAGTGGKVEMGSGPYTLDTFDSLGQWYRLQYFPSYWEGYPNPNCDDYIQTVTLRGIEEWGTRKSMFLAGDADFIYVPRAHIVELILNWGSTPEIYAPGIDCLPNLPNVAVDAIFPVLNLSAEDNPYMGVVQAENDFEEAGIPPDFMSNINVRRGLAYCFNWTQYIEEVFLGEAQQPATPHIEGLAYFDYIRDVGNDDLSPPDTLINPGGPWNQPLLPNGSGPLPPVPYFYRNLTKAEAEFKAALDFEGNSLWDEGFTMTVLYNTGNEPRLLAASMLEEALEGMNSKFHIDVLEVDWPTYLGELLTWRMPFYIIGWLADYPDPHNFVYPFMHSHGTFSYFQAYANATVDALINAGVSTTDDNERILIYNELGQIYHRDAVSIPTIQATGRHWERDWVEGWYYNPIYSGSFFYHYWKAEPMAWEEIDLSAEGTITPTTTPAELQVYEGEYTLSGSAFEQNYSIHVERVDTNPSVTYVYGVIDLRRHDPVDLYDFIVAEDDQTSAIFTLTAGDEFTFNCTYNEALTAEEGTYQLSGYVTAISGSAYDNVTANNDAPDGTFTASELVGDIDGSGEVDIFDAIQLAGAFGSSVGEERWNALADLNGDGIIDIFDAILLAGGFGDSIP